MDHLYGKFLTIPNSIFAAFLTWVMTPIFLFASRGSSLGLRIYGTNSLSPFRLRPNCEFFQNAKCICSKCKIYLCKMQNVFVQNATCICKKCKMCLSKLQNVFLPRVEFGFVFMAPTAFHPSLPRPNCV